MPTSTERWVVRGTPASGGAGYTLWTFENDLGSIEGYADVPLYTDRLALAALALKIYTKSRPVRGGKVVALAPLGGVCKLS